MDGDPWVALVASPVRMEKRPGWLCVKALARARKGWYCLEDTSSHRDEQNPYTEDNLPYYDYSSEWRPAQPLIPPPSPPHAPASPKRSRSRGLPLIVAAVSVVLVVGVIFLSGFSQLLLRPAI